MRSTLLRTIFLLTVLASPQTLQTFPLFAIPPVDAQTQPTNKDWYMAGANPERTSWVNEQVEGASLEWYRPIEAYIDQRTQIIAAEGKIFLSTSGGLYAFTASNGNLAWRFNTDMPIGNAPTVFAGVVYVPGYDRTIRALNANTGSQNWMFTGALAGFSTNPLVVNPGNGLKVYAGNRDGYFYAINASNGQLAWQYPPATQNPLGPIAFDAAYKDNVIYFVSNDMFAYAVNASTGALIAKSAKLPGEGFNSYWPVIYRDKLVIRAGPNYRNGIQNSVFGVQDLGIGQHDDYVNGLERNEVWAGGGNAGSTFTSSSSNGSWNWANGTTVLDGTRFMHYLRNKPYRRTMVVLNLNNLSEFTYSDGSTSGNYAPVLFWGTKSGNGYPSVVMPDNVIYQLGVRSGSAGGGIPGGEVMGWQLGTKYLSLARGHKAADEPVALSGGGNLIYWVHLCDRNGHAVYDVSNPGRSGNPIRHYYGEDVLPGVNTVWREFTEDPWDDDLHSYYRGLTTTQNSINGVYSCHGAVNPFVPYQGRLYTHRMNVLYAFGAGGSTNKGTVTVNQPNAPVASAPTINQLKARLEREIQKMVTAGQLRSGYHNNGQLFSISPWIYNDLFTLPGDTLTAVGRAYPHLSSSLKTQALSYMDTEYNTFFASTFRNNRGWNNGSAREYASLPPDLDARRSIYGYESGWDHSQYYGLWKYAQSNPSKANDIYNRVRTQMTNSVGNQSQSSTEAWQRNKDIMGHIGFLKLQELAGRTTDTVNSLTRSSIQNRLNEMMSARASGFVKDVSAISSIHNVPDQRQRVAVARNFLYMTPELGNYLSQNRGSLMQQSFNEYEYVAPFWFVTNFGSTHSEGINQLLYDTPAMFSAKAWIMKHSYQEVAKHLDTNFFAAGDLYYINNLVTAIEVGESSGTTPGPTVPPPSTPTPTSPGGTCTKKPQGDADCNGVIDLADFEQWRKEFTGTASTKLADFNGDGSVTIVDFERWRSGFF